MAAPWLINVRHGKQLFRQWHLLREVRRYILSENYYCRNEWQKRLQSPTLSKLNFNDLSLLMLENFEKNNRSSLVDMDVLSNKITEMSYANVDIVEDLIYKFHHSKDGFPIRDSIVHAIIRGYIELDLTHRLLPMIKNRMDFGILPDFFSANILMDHFIKKDMFKDAAEVACQMALQEDFSNKVTFLLSLHSCTKYLYQIADQRPPEVEEKTEEEEEIEWVRVKLIHRPVYDDHFDIKDERFLLGKTLYMLGRELDVQDVMARSLQIAGLGLYNKFSKALDLLEGWVASGQEKLVLENQLNTFKNCLEVAQVQDPEEKEKDLGERTVDDEIRRLMLTPDEKEQCQARLQALEQDLLNKSLISTEDLDSVVDKYVKGEIHRHEDSDIENQIVCYKKWEIERAEMIQRQIQEYERKIKQKEVEKLLLEIAEKEELLESYNRKNEIHLARLRMPREKVYRPDKELDEDELEEKLKVRKSVIKKK